jgi:hypothetical protein
MGERLDAEAVRELMFVYFHEMRAAIERHGGTVEKFVGLGSAGRAIRAKGKADPVAAYRLLSVPHTPPSRRPSPRSTSATENASRNIRGL